MDMDRDNKLIMLRCENAIDCVMKGLISSRDLIKGLQMPDPHFQHLTEDVGLCQIFHSYENVKYDEWVCPLTLFSSTAQRAPTIFQ